jgi:tetratricopeptide (TPR) repeat protein
LTPVGHPNRPASLHNLANVLWTRYEQLGDMEDLQSAIRLYHEALSLCPIGHPNRPKSLNNLASALQIRYSQLEEVEDLHSAIRLCQEALSLRPTGHPDRSSSLNNLANALQARYYANGGESLVVSFTLIRRMPYLSSR